MVVLVVYELVVGAYDSQWVSYSVQVVGGGGWCRLG